MHRYTKAIIQACERASINIRRDLSEINHLQASRNLKVFLSNSQLRFEKNMAYELKSMMFSNIFIYKRDGSSKNIIDTCYSNEVQKQGSDDDVNCIVLGIDNIVNLSHGIDNIAIAIYVVEGGDLTDEAKVIAAAICIPAQQTIAFTDTDNEAFIMGSDGLIKRLRMNPSTNIILPVVVCSTDNPRHNIDRLLPKRDIHFVSSGSILYDAMMVIENKVDIGFYSTPSSHEYLTAIKILTNAAGGSDLLLEKSYIFGKKSIMNAIIQQNIQYNNVD